MGRFGKPLFQWGWKGGSVVHYQSCFLIPIGAKVDLDTKTLILQEIWHKSVRMVCHEGWWDWGQSDRRPAPRGMFCAHVGQECPNGFLSFVLNWNLSGVRLCMGVVWCSWPDLQCQSAINSSEYCIFLRRNVCSRRIERIINDFDRFWRFWRAVRAKVINNVGATLRCTRRVRQKNGRRWLMVFLRHR